MYASVCLYVCINVYECMCICICTHMCVCIYVNVYVYECMCMCKCICMCTYMYVCAYYVCMCICINAHFQLYHKSYCLQPEILALWTFLAALHDEVASRLQFPRHLFECCGGNPSGRMLWVRLSHRLQQQACLLNITAQQQPITVL